MRAFHVRSAGSSTSSASAFAAYARDHSLSHSRSFIHTDRIAAASVACIAAMPSGSSSTNIAKPRSVSTPPPAIR